MASFLGTYTNLTNFRVSGFLIEGLSGRDGSGRPVWRLVCDICSFPQSLSHARLAPIVQGRNSQVSLLCQNPACPQSHKARQVETLADIRREERQAVEQAEEAKRVSDAKAAKEQVQAARAYEIQRQYTRYVNHQLKAGQSDENICTRPRWFSLSDASRSAVLDAMQKNPT